MTISRQFQSYDSPLPPGYNLNTPNSPITFLSSLNMVLANAASFVDEVTAGTLRSNFTAPDGSVTVNFSTGTVVLSGGSVSGNIASFSSLVATDTAGSTRTAAEGAFSINLDTWQESGTYTSVTYSLGLTGPTSLSYRFGGQVSVSGTAVSGFMNTADYSTSNSITGVTTTTTFSLTSALVGQDYVTGSFLLAPATMVTDIRTVGRNAFGATVHSLAMEGSPTVSANTPDLFASLMAGNDTVYLSGDGDRNAQTGFGGDDILYGDNGDTYFDNRAEAAKLIHSGLGNDLIDGGGGNDVVYFGSNKPVAGYSFSWIDAATQSILIVDNSSGDNTGSDHLISIERFDFGDVILDWGLLSQLMPHVPQQGAMSGILRYGGSPSETLEGSLFDDAIYGNSGTDALTGLDGRDLLFGGEENDSIDGGAGLDFAGYSNVRSSYTISKNATGWTVSDNSGVEGADTLVGVERLKFADVSVALDVDGSSAQAYRVYQAAFDRAPDLGGLGFWIGMMDNGMSVTEVAANFVGSVEFRNTYGSLNNNDFAAQLYRNVLHRESDAGGLSFWTDALDQQRLSRPEVLAAFSESNENQANLIGVIQDGFAYT